MFIIFFYQFLSSNLLLFKVIIHLQIYLMSSFRDKLNSKLNINTNNKLSTQKLTSFDETFLKINVVGGQTQLCPIKLNCQWAQPNIHNKQPELVCKWFNKTESSMALIEGIVGSYYQPCFSDVGTIIHVQCMPELEGVEYEGMPIIKEIGPVKIDPETQQQANELLAGKKATFMIKVRYVNQDPWNVEGLVRIQNNTIKIVSKTNQGQKQLLSEQINENNIKVKSMRTKSKQLQISTVNEENKILIELTNNKIRDVLVLLIKLTFAMRTEEEPQMVSQPISVFKEEKKEQNEQRSLDKIQLTNSSSLNEDQSSLQQSSNVFQDQNLSSTSYSSSIQEKNSSQEQNSNSQEIKTNQLSDIKQKQSSAKGSADQKSLKSEQQFKVVCQKVSEVNEIKSSEDLSNIASPKTKLQKTEYTVGQLTPSVKTNALQVLQLNDLKKQMRVKQGQISQLKKALGEKNDKIEEIQDLMNRMKERESNLSCNYFQLQDEVKKLKQTMEKNSEEISYYRNENKILKSQCESLSKKNKQLLEKVIQTEEKLAPFLNNSEQVQQKQTFQELKQKYLSEQKLREEVNAKYEYMKEEVVKGEQKLIQLKQMLERAEEQKKFYKKKYESASQEYSSGSLKLSQISIKSTKLLNQEKGQEMKMGLTNFKLVKYEQQILELKKQLKQLVEMNNFLRETSAITSKDKKSTSKTQLKLELLELKKIVNRLTEAITEKDLALDHMKSINKQLNQKLIDSQKKIVMMQQELKIHQISSS